MSRLYQTTDYRTAMAAEIEARDLRHRDIALACERSEGWLSLVLSGRRQLDPELVGRVAKALGLDEEESIYFGALVDLNNPSPRARKNAWATVRATQHQHAAASFTEDIAALYSRWYVGAIPELARCANFRPDPRWIAQALQPPITAEQAEEALTRLVRLGMLAPDEDGGLRPSEPYTWSPSDLPKGPISQAVARFHSEALTLAADALTGANFNERHYSSLVFPVSEAHYPKLVAMLRDLERQIGLEALQGEETPNRVYLLGFQFFPVSLYTDSEVIEGASGPDTPETGEP